MSPADPRQTKFVLDESRIPRAWYNIAADLPVPPSPHAAPRHARAASGPDDLAPLFPMALIGQEVVGRARDRDPGAGPRRLPAVPAEPALPRASPRAGARYAGAHLLQVRGRQPGRAATSPTRRSPQAFYNKQEGVKRIATETGAGQWGSALAFAGALFGLEVKVYMVRASYDQKPYRRILMETYGARGRRQPVADDELRPRRAGRDARTARARSGMAISEAVEDAATRDDTKYALGSRAQPRPAAPDGHRPGGASSRWGWPASRPTSSSAARAAARTSPGSTFPFLGPQLPRGRQAPDHRRRAGGRPEPDPRRLRLRLRRHGQDGAGRQDAHPRPRLHPRADPRGRPALPRHVAAGQPAQGARRTSRREASTSARASRPASSSPGPRGSCRRPSRPTRSASRSTRRSPPGRPARRRSSCSTCAATATSTCRRTSAT